jgi:hypothetical protein
MAFAAWKASQLQQNRALRLAAQQREAARRQAQAEALQTWHAKQVTNGKTKWHGEWHGDTDGTADRPYSLHLYVLLQRQAVVAALLAVDVGRQVGCTCVKL